MQPPGGNNGRNSLGHADLKTVKRFSKSTLGRCLKHYISAVFFFFGVDRCEVCGNFLRALALGLETSELFPCHTRRFQEALKEDILQIALSKAISQGERRLDKESRLDGTVR